jgi:hypothetical protein
MPHEFWREVVDRVAAEVPGTLLLAEAFWLMEGYFVRTLGMHRVYNSAFMNMLRDEDNAKYRSVIKNTLEFDPDIMKRYVNFMSNPDERTAIDQFGTGDKCFGVAAHGHAARPAHVRPRPDRGLHREIRHGVPAAALRRDPDHWLVERHEREIAPLLQARWLFAESSNFLLYDFFRGSGTVDENVFAYSNRNGDERALVVYNNRYGTTRMAPSIFRRLCRQGRGQLRQQRLREGLGLQRRSRAHPRLPRLAHRPRIPAPRRAICPSAASPSICTPTSATSFSTGASCAPPPSSPGTGSATSSTDAAFPISTMRW